MSTLVFNALLETSLVHMKDQLLHKIQIKTTPEKLPFNDSVYFEVVKKDEVVSCSCCGWKGKGSETKKKCLFLEHATELELFCNNCSSYIGFISIKKQNP